MRSDSEVTVEQGELGSTGARRRAPRPRRDRRRAADRRRAVELLARVRRRADPEAVPPRRAGRSTRSSSCCASCPRADSSNIAPLYGWDEFEGRLIDATLGMVQEFLADARDGWELALDELARDPDGFLDRLARARRGDRRACTPCSARSATDPAFSPDEPSQEALSILTADGRRADRAGLRPTCPTRRRSSRSPAAGRTCRSACRCSRTSAPAAGDPHARRLPPRPDHAHARPRLGDPRLRGRAGPLAARAAPEALAAARRGRACCARSPTPPPARRSSAASTAPEDWEEPRARAFLEGYLEQRRPGAAAPRPAGDATSCSRSSSSRRPSTSCATSSTTGPTGSRSPWPASSGCSSPSSSPARGDLLHRPPLPSGSLKKTKPTLSSGCGCGRAVLAEDLELADLHAALLAAALVPPSRPATTSCRPLSEPAGMSATMPSPIDDRASRAGRRELHDPHARRRPPCRGRRRSRAAPRRRPSRAPRPRPAPSPLPTSTACRRLLVFWEPCRPVTPGRAGLIGRGGAGTLRPWSAPSPSRRCCSRSCCSSGPPAAPAAAQDAARTARFCTRAAPSACPDLRLLTVTHLGFDGRPRHGQLVVHQPRHRGRFPSVFRRSTAPASPSATCASPTSTGPRRSRPNDVTASLPVPPGRSVAMHRRHRHGTRSNHAYGLAIDLNPRENPYVGCGQSHDPTTRPYLQPLQAAVRGMIAPARIARLRRPRLGLGRLVDRRHQGLHALLTQRPLSGNNLGPARLGGHEHAHPPHRRPRHHRAARRDLAR